MISKKYSVFGNLICIIEIDFITISNNLFLTTLVYKICEFDKSVEGVAFISNLKFNFKYRFFNSDLSEELICGNSLYAIGKYLNIDYLSFHRQEIDINIKKIKDNIFLHTKYNIKNIFLHQNNIIDVGTPHMLIETNNIQDINWSDYNNKYLNITVFKLEENIAYVRTFERGVNKETFACGTGAFSVFIYCYMNNIQINEVIYLKSMGSYNLYYIYFGKEIELNIFIKDKNVLEL